MVNNHFTLISNIHFGSRILFSKISIYLIIYPKQVQKLLGYISGCYRTNLFEEGRNDENVGQNQSTKDPLQIRIGSITRARAKKLQETLNGLVKEFIWANPTFKEFDEFF